MALFDERFGHGFMETARATSGLFSSWSRIVTDVWPRTYSADADVGGDDIPAAAIHSRIRELERGVLLVEADHPGWIQILQTKQTQLLAGVQRRYPELGVRGIAFRLSREPLSVPGEKTSAADEMVARPEPEEQELSSETAPMRRRPRNEELYASLKSLEENFIKRNNYK
jgi:hypothetical protein